MGSLDSSIIYDTEKIEKNLKELTDLKPTSDVG